MRLLRRTARDLYPMDTTLYLSKINVNNYSVFLFIPFQVAVPGVIKVLALVSGQLRFLGSRQSCAPAVQRGYKRIGLLPVRLRVKFAGGPEFAVGGQELT